MITITPYLQQDKLGEYQDKLVDLYMADAALNQTIPDSIRSSTEWLLRQVNCFYSNKIEGNPTHPKELLKTQDKNAPQNTGSMPAPLLELLAHLEAQLKAKTLASNLDEVCKQQFIQDLHRAFYAPLPAEHLKIKNLDGQYAFDDSGQPITIEPGSYRSLQVQVGAHIPPLAEELPSYMQWLEDRFKPTGIYGTNRVIAAAALHHRLAWIHPFQDGNGRVIRLLTDCYMRCAGFEGYGLWSITRGFGRNTKAYYAALAEADKPRQGNSDGRGILSDGGLLHFTRYFIDTALDQVRFFSNLLEPRKLGIRVDYYFEMRAKGGLPDDNGTPLPLLKIAARDIYRLLLEKGPMSRIAICQHLGKGEQTLRPIIKQMANEGLISAKPKQDIQLKISTNAVEFLFPQIW